ncbi:helix-turn-helix domain-containing protein [Geomonas agri]|uniref:helix-turn-helix domain-containing protein n=1 Tax=Geomonas agri TaxID=2873702 RepID=UPI001CD59A38|nr:helix-turn-helix domain-containing protein [Geomonas agri]
MIPVLNTAKTLTEPHQLELFGYHSLHRGGFFSLVTKTNVTRQKSYPMNALPVVIRSVNPKIDTYLSQAEFFRPNRRIVNLAHLGVSFVDLDSYKTITYKEISSDQMVGELLLHCIDCDIPMPSVILFSGQGYYAKWFYTRAIPRQALPRWNALQNELCQRFVKFGADRKARDASRILRLEGTCNTKTGGYCRVIWPDAGKEPIHYDFDALCDAVLPFSRDELTDLRDERAAKKVIRDAEVAARRASLTLVKGGGKAGNLRRFNPLQLSWDRLEDLRALAKLRGGVQVGMRDEFLYLATCTLAHIVDPGTLKLELHQLAHEFAPSLTISEVVGYTSTAVKRAEDAATGSKINFNGKLVDSRYKFRNSTLVDRLEITPDEERHLKTIISEAEARRRDAARKYDLRHAAGATTRSEYLAQAERNRERAIILRSQGLKIKVIAQDLKVSVSAVEKYLKA